MAEISNEMLSRLPRDRDVISFCPGLDELGRMFLLKLRLKDRREEVMHLPPAIAFHVRRVSRPHRSPIWVGSGTADGMSGWRCGARGAGARSTSRTASCAASSATAARRAG